MPCSLLELQNEGRPSDDSSRGLNFQLRWKSWKVEVSAQPQTYVNRNPGYMLYLDR